MVNPSDEEKLIKGFDKYDGVLLWGAEVVKTEVQQKGLILVCSSLFEEEAPLHMHQITSIVDISDL